MKKILLIIALTFCILQLIVLAVAIDIGTPAINRTGSYGGGLTMIVAANPANASGKITQVQIYCNVNLEGCEVATFYNVGGSNWTTRDNHTIGSVSSGAIRTFDVDLDVVAGDRLGIYYSGGNIDMTTGGGSGWYYDSGDRIPCTSNGFTSPINENTISLYGTGVSAPGQVTNVQATDGVHTDKVVITWDDEGTQTGYDVWTGSSWVDVGDVQTYDHTTAPAPTITVGTASASDGTSLDHVTLSIAGESANNGSSVSYKVRAYSAGGNGAESAPNDGYRGVGSLTYQWQRSAGDSDADYSNIDGATTDPYNDTGAPENGDGRYYKCVENATGAAEQTTNSDRGYREVEEEEAVNSFFFGTNI